MMGFAQSTENPFHEDIAQPSTHLADVATQALNADISTDARDARTDILCTPFVPPPPPNQKTHLFNTQLNPPPSTWLDHQHPNPEVVTPIKLERLRHHLLLCDIPNNIRNYLIDGFTRGFLLHHNKTPTNSLFLLPWTASPL